MWIVSREIRKKEKEKKKPEEISNSEVSILT